MPSLAITLHLLTFLTFAIARPTTLVARNQSSTCAQFDSVTSGPYAIQNDIWGATSGGGQSQCSQITSFDGTNVAWTSQFSWSGAANSVKTYANAEASSNTACKALSQYNSIKTSWQWSYPPSAQITGDVSYDAFLASTCNGPGDPHPYEIMVWLAAIGGLNPIGTAGATINIGSQSWVLWSGTNTQTQSQVFSFVATSQVNSFDGDLMDFFKYLVQNNGVDDSLLLTSVQAGTEISVGSSTFTTTKYSIAGA